MKLVRRAIRRYTERASCAMYLCISTEQYKGHGEASCNHANSNKRVVPFAHNHAPKIIKRFDMFQRVYPGQGSGYEATCAAAGTVCRNPPTALKLNGQRITSQYCQFHACRQVEGGRACPNAKLPRAVVCSQRELMTTTREGC